MNNNQDTEIWLPIKNYEKYYQISNLGRVRSLDRVRNNRRGSWIYNGIILSLPKNGKGYRYVGLHAETRKTYRVNRLVAQAFLGLNIGDKKMCVCHRDDDPLNNMVDNLFLGTAKDNAQDAISKGRWHNQKISSEVLNRTK